MLHRSWLVGLLIGISALIADAGFGRGQGLYPPGLEIRPPAAASAPALPPADADLSGTISTFGPARTPTPWYADGEVAVLYTAAYHFNDYFGTVSKDNAIYVSPRIYLGYRLENGGAIRFTYRNLTEVGRRGASEESYGDWSSGNSFSSNWFDIDYVSREFAPLDWWRVQLEVGGRFVYRREDWWTQSTYHRTESSQDYFGGGPHLGLMSHVLLGRSGWALYGRADAAVTFGGGATNFRYEPRPQQDSWGWVDSPRTDRQTFRECQFDLGLQLGLARRAEWRGRAIGLMAGVQADLLTRGDLSGDWNTFGIVNIGPFLRLEIGF